jgi:universal stress protein A
MSPNIQRILVPTDFSEHSDAAVDYAAALAWPLWASVHLIHVIDDPYLFQGALEFPVPENIELRERIRQECERKLAATAAVLRERCAKVTTEVRTGRAIDQVIDAAVDYGADLIVMGTHGRSGLSHLVYGSVAERVIRTARCPVLAVRGRCAAAQPATQGEPALAHV